MPEFSGDSYPVPTYPDTSNEGVLTISGVANKSPTTNNGDIDDLSGRQMLMHHPKTEEIPNLLWIHC